jgi:serine/threonine-protein kinase
MVTGQLPFKGDHGQAVTYSILNEDPEPMTGLRTGVPMELEKIVNKSLAKEPAERYQHVDEVIVDLRGLQKVVKPKSTPTATTIRTSSKKKIGAFVPVIALGVLVLAIITYFFFVPGERESISERKIMVVLPFENLGPAEDEYFADGITDAITARLARLRNLGVISRQSAVQYKNSNKSPEQISEELGGVQYLLEGTVQRERPSDPTSRVRIIPQLINVADNTHLWAETYDDEFSEVFRVHSQIAERVAQALQVMLLERERQSLAGQPTNNLEAYELYLSAAGYSRGRLDEIRIAVQLLERAVELDPQFALAYVLLSRFHAGAFFFGQDRSETRRINAKKAAELALELDPKLPEAHLALGYYYYEGERDYDRALKAFAVARRGLPSEVSILTAEALIWRRQGKLKQASENFEKAFTLHPRSWSIASQLGVTLIWLRRYAEAESYLDKTIALGPDATPGYTWQARNYLTWHGDTQRARVVLERMPKGIDRSGTGLLAWMRLHQMERSYPEALTRLTASPFEVISGKPWFVPKTQLLGEVYQTLGDTTQAHTAYHAARTLLEREVAKHPDDSRLRSALGLVYAGLGRKQDAIREGRQAADLEPVSKDIMAGLTRREDLARIYVAVREPELAVDQLEYLVSSPIGLSISPASLRVDPHYDPLRGNLRFERLLEEHKN